MAHFVELDTNNTVLRGIVVANAELLDENGQESEQRGVAFCHQLFGPEGVWVQTSYNATFRKNYAGIGYTYDSARDAFIPPKPSKYPSWVIDEDTCRWVPPLPYPDDGAEYYWSETDLEWKFVDESEGCIGCGDIDATEDP
jgi:hypothetical protein